MYTDTIAVIGDSHVNFFGGSEYITFTPFLHKLRTGGGAWESILVRI